MKDPTIRQKRAATIAVREITEGDGTKSKGKMIAEAGYGKDMQDHPRKVFGSEIVREEINRQLAAAGISPEYVAGRLYWLMAGAGKKDPTATIGAIREYAKISGAYAPTKTETDITGLIQHTIDDDKGDYLDYLKEKNKKLKIVDGEIIED